VAEVTAGSMRLGAIAGFLSTIPHLVEPEDAPDFADAALRGRRPEDHLEAHKLLASSQCEGRRDWYLAPLAEANGRKGWYLTPWLSLSWALATTGYGSFMVDPPIFDAALAAVAAAVTNLAAQSALYGVTAGILDARRALSRGGTESAAEMPALRFADRPDLETRLGPTLVERIAGIGEEFSEFHEVALGFDFERRPSTAQSATLLATVAAGTSPERMAALEGALKKVIDLHSKSKLPVQVHSRA